MSRVAKELEVFAEDYVPFQSYVSIVLPRTHLNIADIDLSLFDLKDFGKCTDIMLKAVICLGKYTCLKNCIDVDFVWLKKKGKLNDSYNGAQNMITVAHRLRSNISVFPTVDYYRYNMIVKRVTLPTFHENYLPSIFNA